jgi:hypothetical protein
MITPENGIHLGHWQQAKKPEVPLTGRHKNNGARHRGDGYDQQSERRAVANVRSTNQMGKHREQPTGQLPNEAALAKNPLDAQTPFFPWFKSVQNIAGHNPLLATDIDMSVVI